MVYIDEFNHCHTENPDGMHTPVETYFFNGKCKDFVEGYCIELNGDGTIKQIYPWKPSSELDAAQRKYERQLIAIYEESLRTMGVVI